jgi:hypothetical protein
MDSNFATITFDDIEVDDEFDDKLDDKLDDKFDNEFDDNSKLPPIPMLRSLPVAASTISSDVLGQCGSPRHASNYLKSLEVASNLDHNYSPASLSLPVVTTPAKSAFNSDTL